MSLKYTVDMNGDTRDITPQRIMSDMAAAGIPVTGFSPDGLFVYARDPDTGAEMEAPAANLVAKYGQLKNVAPEEADTSGLNWGWRLGVEAVPNDDNVRASFLRSKLQEQGVADPQIVGSGVDWNYFNPSSGKWMALTNSEGLDMSDVAGILPDAARFAGEVVGGTAGMASMAPTGPGALVGGVVGSGMGRLAADATIAGIGSIDPQFREALTSEEGIRAQAGDTGKGMLAAGVFGAIPGLSKAASPVLSSIGKAAMGPGVASTVARGTGAVVEGAGAATQAVSKGLDNPIGRGFVAAATPGLGTAQMAGWLAQGPAYAATKGSELLGKAAKFGYKQTKNISPETARKFAGLAEETRRWRMPTDRTAGTMENLAKAAVDPDAMRNLRGGMGQGARDVTARRVYGRIGERLGQTVDNLRGKYAQNAGKDLVNPNAATKAFGSAGRGFGRVADSVGSAGRTVEGAVDKTVSAGLKVGRGVGMGMEQAGRVLNRTARAVAPLENRAILFAGQRQAEDHLPVAASQADDILREWWKLQNRSGREIYGGN